MALLVPRRGFGPRSIPLQGIAFTRLAYEAYLERMGRIKLPTLTLARSRSVTELHPRRWWASHGFEPGNRNGLRLQRSCFDLLHTRPIGSGGWELNPLCLSASGYEPD